MRVILFMGKGGVGKTSVAAATALHSAEAGYKTIILPRALAGLTATEARFEEGKLKIRFHRDKERGGEK